jgi:hypothetical protein
MLRAPTYAGIYAYGKSQVRNSVSGRKRDPIPEEKWISNIEDHHEGYISVNDYRANCAALKCNRTRDGATPPREGNALIQGIAICSQCGGKMTATYKTSNGEVYYWQYVCSRVMMKHDPHSHDHYLCVSGRTVDDAVSSIVLDRLTPEAVKSAEKVLHELEKRRHSEDNFFAKQVDNCKYEVVLAKKRYMNADPENRLVCSELERLWNERMSQLAKAESELVKSRAVTASELAKTDVERLLCLPEKLREAWRGDDLCMTDKKRIVRCLIEDVALGTSGDEINIGIRFKGGTTELISIPRPLKKHETWTTDPEIVEYIRESSKRLPVEDIVNHLNGAGKKAGKGSPFTLASVRGIQYSHDIPSLKEHLRSIGYLSTSEKAKQMGISPSTLNNWRISDKYPGKCVKTTGGGDYMYEQ